MRYTADDIDVAIRAGRGPWGDLHREKVIAIDFTPMCSPAFLARHLLTRPSDLLDVPRISPHDPWWAQWLHEAGVDVPPGRRAPRAAVRLDSQAQESHAAVASQGMAMLTPFFWRTDLAEERLARPFEQISTHDYAYWLVFPKHRRTTLKIRRFRDWLLGELAHAMPSSV